MKTKKITFYLLAVLLGGCLPSLHQLYLILQLVDHEEVLELLQNDSASRERNATNACYFFEGIRSKL